MGSLRSLKRQGTIEAKNYEQSVIDKNFINSIISEIQHFSCNVVIRLPYKVCSGACVPQCTNRILDWIREQKLTYTIEMTCTEYRIEVWR